MITDEMLYAAAAKSSAAFVNRMEKDYDPKKQHTFSAKFEHKIKHLIRKANHPSLYRGLRKVASVLLAILIGGCTWLAVDVEARAAFIGWLREVYDNIFSYRYSDDVELENKDTKYQITWVPENYVELFSDYDSSGGSALYENEDGYYLQFMYITNPSESSLFVENTDTIKYELMVNGCFAEYLESNDPESANSLVWTNEYEHLFYIAAILEQDELVKIAESVQTVE